MPISSLIDEMLDTPKYSSTPTVDSECECEAECYWN